MSALWKRDFYFLRNTTVCATLPPATTNTNQHQAAQQTTTIVVKVLQVPDAENICMNVRLAFTTRRTTVHVHA